jgi:hemerythrin superfamily protein
MLKSTSALPSVTGMIRLDHTHVLALFRRYKPDISLRRKRAIVANACLALEIHAQLEEEIFYPALRGVMASDAAMDKSVSEHDEMRRLIAQVRGSEPGCSGFDESFRELIRTVLHHVADEETVLLPRAELELKASLGRLGLQMTKRRMELLRPHAGEVLASGVQAFPVATAVAFGAVLCGLALFLRSSSRALQGPH